MIDKDHVELGAAEIGQTSAGRKRDIAKLGMGVVDDVGGNFDRRF